MLNKPRLVMIGIACITVFLLSGISLFGQATKRIALLAPDDVALIVYCEGVVKVNGESVDIGSRIPDGATLVTASDAFVEVVFNQKNIIRISGGSIVTLDLSKLAKVVSIEQGSVGAVLRQLDKLSGGNLKVRTKGSVAGVRGTSLFAKVDPAKPDASYYCICNGTLELTDPDGSGATTMKATHHHAKLREKTASGYKETGVRLADHDDKAMEALAARIGETIDWNRLEE